MALSDDQWHVHLGTHLGSPILQVIVEKAEHGDTDHIKHSLDLFVDFVAIFVRILVIMLQNAERKEERRDSRKRRQ